MSDATHNARIDSELAELASQSKPNYTATAKKWSVERTTLAKRHKGQTISKQATNAQFQQRLNVMQEEDLIGYINKLTDRGMPPMSWIVRNLAEEMVGLVVAKNWMARFVWHHKDWLKSLYLRTIDNMRKKSEYAPVFKLFYHLVKYLALNYKHCMLLI